MGASKLRAIIATVGSPGDIHPLLAVGLGLRDRGHEVVFATNDFFEEMVRDSGLDFRPIGRAEDYNRLRDIFDPESLVKSVSVLFNYIVLPSVRPAYELVTKNWVPERTVVISPPAVLGARIAREKLDMSLVSVHFSAFLLRSNIRPPRAPGLWMPDWMPNRIKDGIWRLNDVFLDRILCPSLNALRQELGLGPQKRVFGAWANSPDKVLGLFPAWFAPKQVDWPPQTELTGFPLFDEETALPHELQAFLEEGAPPIVFTPGSAFKKVRGFFQASAQAVHKLGRRAIFLTRYREQLPEPLPPGIRHYDYAPLGRLLPHAAALVYHGGIGTCAQALRAAIPHLVMPMAADQYDNAARLEALGVAAELSRKQYQGTRVAETLGTLLKSKAVQSECNQLAERLRDTDSVAAACRAIERTVQA